MDTEVLMEEQVSRFKIQFPRKLKYTYNMI